MAYSDQQFGRSESRLSAANSTNGQFDDHSSRLMASAYGINGDGSATVAPAAPAGDSSAPTQNGDSANVSGKINCPLPDSGGTSASASSNGAPWRSSYGRVAAPRAPSFYDRVSSVTAGAGEFALGLGLYNGLAAARGWPALHPAESAGRYLQQKFSNRFTTPSPEVSDVNAPFEQAAEAAPAAAPERAERMPLSDIAKADDGTGDGWVKIYNEAFPPNESEPVADIRQRIADGDTHLFVTRDMNGNVASFSLFDDAAPIARADGEHPLLLNSYNATRSDLRSQGIGSKHIPTALENLNAERPGSLVAFEIDHTGLQKIPTLETLTDALKTGDYSKLGPLNPDVELTPEEFKTNLSRLKFYLQLEQKTGGALNVQVADVDYQMPDLEELTNPSVPAHLLVYRNAETPALDNGEISQVLKGVYEHAYELEPDNPLIARVLDTVGKTGIADALEQTAEHL
ncbi:MAG TPA: hypothetical protein V6C72_07625 [Chroococcales cyanobacterium]